MKTLALLVALVLPGVAAAASPLVTDGPDVRLGGAGASMAGWDWELICPLPNDAGEVACSDGRQVATTRAGPAWCDGGYQVGDNAPCVSAAGLESKGAVLNYWTNSTRPDLWNKVGLPTVTADPGGGYVLTDDDPASDESLYVPAGSPQAGPWTITCALKAGTLNTARVYVSSSDGAIVSCPITGLGPTYKTFSCSGNAATAPTWANPTLYVGSTQAQTGSIVVEWCQLVYSATPGRRCDAGASPTTCPGDAHTVASAGWPVASGKIRFNYTPAYSGTAPYTRVLLDTRKAALDGGLLVSITTGGALRLELRQADTTNTGLGTVALGWGADTTYPITVGWAGSTATISRGPGESASGAMPGPMGPHAISAALGVSNLTAGGQAEGRISGLEAYPR